MAHVVTEPCKDCKYTDCVVECPVECFYQDGEMLVIHADDCIDCGACVPACPVGAIYRDSAVPDQWTSYIELNATKATALKAAGHQITKHQAPLKGPGCKEVNPKPPVKDRTKAMVEIKIVHEDFFCPVTGEHVLSEEHCEPSPATIFIFLNSENAFEVADKAIERLYEMAEELSENEDVCDSSWDIFLQLLAKQPEYQNLVLFTQSSFGMACGPIFHSVTIAIDLAYCGPGDESE